jgi:hypothetical protein
MKSLSELESENADFRAARSNADAEITRLRDRRETLLLTASIDEIVKIDDEIRRQEITGEIADAKGVALRGPIYQARFLAQRYAGVAMPSDEELKGLLDIVAKAHPDSIRNDDLSEFRNAFFGVALMYRLREPDSSRYFISILDDVNLEILRPRRLTQVNGDMLFAAILSHGDVPWRRGAVGLALNTGKPAASRWREILNGAPLLPPLPQQGMQATSSAYPTPRVRIRYGDGREVDPSKDSWAH